MTAPLPPQADPAAPMQPPQMPWTPFAPMPTDSEPAIASLRRRRLQRLIDSAKFEAMDPTWQSVATAEYERMRQIEAAAAQPVVPAPGQQPPKPQQPPPPGQSP